METIKELERKIEGSGKWVSGGERRKGKRRRGMSNERVEERIKKIEWNLERKEKEERR